jgi:tetraacyldisaccharide 4'-kinase
MLPTPKFWNEKNLLANILIPLSVLYFLIVRTSKLFEKSETKFKFFSIFVGNVVAGGAGKTPTVCAIAKIIKNKFPDKKLCVISKGYGGGISKPTLINPQTHTAYDAGDEPIIISKYCDVIVANNRFQACKFADENNYEIVIFDDGIHDARIHKDISLMVIDGKYGFGNGLVMPAGPLRDRADIAMKKATHIVLISRDEKNILKKLELRKSLKPVFNSHITNITNHDKSRAYLAFAGLARPEKFFQSLQTNLGLNIQDTVEFPDHYYYNNDDLNYIKKRADKNNLKILTTEKDFVKLPEAFQKEVGCVKIELEFDDNSLLECIIKSLKSHS